MPSGTTQRVLLNVPILVMKTLGTFDKPLPLTRPLHDGELHKRSLVEIDRGNKKIATLAKRPVLPEGVNVKDVQHILK